MAVLSDAEIAERLTGVAGWSRSEEMVAKTFTFRDFSEAMGFVNRVALLAERADHHPDIDIRWNTVRLALATHSEGGITARDFALAEGIEAL